MRINVHSKGFQLTPPLRAVVESRLLSVLGPLRAHVHLVVVHLRVRTGHTRPDTTICEVAVSLHPSGHVRAGAEDAQMSVAIDRASEGIRRAVEREVSRSQRVPGAPPAVGGRVGSGAVEITLDHGRISQLQREMLERPENYLRPIRVREYGRPADVRDDEVTEELEAAMWS